MKARKRALFDVLQVTRELKDTPGQPEIRDMIKGVTQVELYPERISVSTRYARHDFNVNDWIMKDEKGSISRVTDIDFHMNYQIVS